MTKPTKAEYVEAYGQDAQCSVAGCTSPHLARGWCVKHYQRWRTHGDPLMTVPMSEVRANMSASRRGRKPLPETIAKIAAANRGRKNTPEARANISAGTKRGMASPEIRAKISEARSVPLGSTHLNKLGYVDIKTAGGWQREHRVVAGLAPGDGRVPHHIDGDKTNNASSNLRVFESQAAHMRHHNQERAND